MLGILKYKPVLQYHFLIYIFQRFPGLLYAPAIQVIDIIDRMGRFILILPLVSIGPDINVSPPGTTAFAFDGVDDSPPPVIHTFFK